MLNSQNIEDFRSALLAERESLQNSEHTSEQDRAAVTLDQQAVGRLSRMDALQRQAMAQATSRRRQERETRIAAALQRIDEGEYGYCLECGDEIDLRRLTLDPTLLTCVNCATG